MTVTTLRPTSDVEQGWTNSTSGASGIVTLFVDVWDQTFTAWTEIGIDPYLDTGIPDDRVETNIDLAQEGWFTFENSARVEPILDVRVAIYVKGLSGKDAVDCWIHDGTDEHKITPSGGVKGDTIEYAEELLDYCYTHGQQLELCITSWAEINLCKIRLQYVEKKAEILGVMTGLMLINWGTPRNDFEEVDDTGSGDGDTTRIGTSIFEGVNEDELFGFETFNLPGGDEITSVKVFFRAKGTDLIVPPYAAGLVKISGTKYAGAFHRPPLSYTLYSKEWLVNPDTSSPWTESDINDMAAGVRGKSAYKCISKCTFEYYVDARCTQVYIEVTHSAVAPPPVWGGSALPQVQMAKAILG